MWWFVGGIALLILLFIVKHFLWDKPQNEIKELRQDLEKMQSLHKQEIALLQLRLSDDEHISIKKGEMEYFISTFAWKELAELINKKYAFLNINNPVELYRDRIVTDIKKLFCQSIEDMYKYQYLLYLFPQIESIFDGTKVNYNKAISFSNSFQRANNIFDVVNLLNNHKKLATETIALKNKVDFLESTHSNLTAIPYMAEIMADYETYGIERLAKRLDWGYDQERLKKVKSIREIRKDAKEIVEKNKIAQYQLAYILKLFPALSDIIDTEFDKLPAIKVKELSEYDYVRDYLDKEEYLKLTPCERNQLALDRYQNSIRKSKWQIGRDYENYIGYCYTQKGYVVDYTGSYMGLEDLGRDLICKKGEKTLIIQCKYWSSKKQIHENHINQLYGSTISYCIEKNINPSMVKGLLVTNICVSPMARKIADYLNIKIVENKPLGTYPCIKCNINHNEFGELTKIYHLPFDQQYDSVKITKPGEFFAMTCEEAEEHGFRRAFKHLAY